MSAQSESMRLQVDSGIGVMTRLALISQRLEEEVRDVQRVTSWVEVSRIGREEGAWKVHVKKTLVRLQRTASWQLLEKTCFRRVARGPSGEVPHCSVQRIDQVDLRMSRDAKHVKVPIQTDSGIPVDGQSLGIRKVQKPVVFPVSWGFPASLRRPLYSVLPAAYGTATCHLNGVPFITLQRCRL